MKKENFKKLPNGSWQLKYINTSGEEITKVFEADSAEEADRLAAAYLERISGSSSPAKRVARDIDDRKKSGLLN